MEGFESNTNKIWYVAAVVVAVAAVDVVVVTAVAAVVVLAAVVVVVVVVCHSGLVYVSSQIIIITYFRLLDAEIYILFPYRFDFGKSLDKLLIVNKMLKQLYRKPSIGVKDHLYADLWLNLKVYPACHVHVSQTHL